VEAAGLRDLVSSLYETGAAPELWPCTLERLTSFLRAEKATLCLRDRRSLEPLALYLARLDPEVAPRFYRHLLSNPWSEGSLRFPLGAVLRTEHLAAREDLVDSEFYREVLVPLGIEHGLASNLPVSTEILAMFWVYRSKHRRAFGDREEARFGLVAPHLLHALRLQERLETVRAQSAAFQGALERLRLGVFLLDARGRLIFANRAAREVAALDDGLTLAEDELVAAAAAENAALRRLLAEAGRAGALGKAAAGRALTLSRPSRERPFEVLVAPLGGPATSLGPRRPSALLLLSEEPGPWSQSGGLSRPRATNDH
jgi:PAS domain-containing protein